jgi:hypothetical protein
VPRSNSLLLGEAVILNISKLAQKLVESQILLLVLVILALNRPGDFLLFHLLWIYPELLPSVQGRNGVQESSLLLIVGDHGSVGLLGHGKASMMVLQVNWQVIALLSHSSVLLVQRYTSIVVKTRVPVVHSRHHRVALEVKGLLTISWRLLLRLLGQRALTLGLWFGSTLQIIFQHVVNNVLLFCELLKFPHPALIITSIVADPCELEDANLLPMVQVKMFAWVIEGV